MDLIPKPLYPLVPNAAGVPAVLRSGARIIDGATGGLLGLSGAMDTLLGTSTEQWGIFSPSSGQSIAIADSVISIQYRNESRISNYPVEEGSFASYNKVASPYDVRIRMVKGGRQEDRSTFLSAIEFAASATDLFTVVTPEKTFENANIVGHDYSRETLNGAYVIIVDIDIQEVRTTAQTRFAETKSPNCAAADYQGQVSADPISATQDSAIKSAAKTLQSVSTSINNTIGAITGSVQSRIWGIF
jgi:hypothetical protein